METDLRHANPERLLTRRQMQRIEEPWFMSRIVAVAGGLLLAVLFGYYGANGDVDSLIIWGVWLTAIAIIVFVRSYWWAPALIITALSFHTFTFGFAMSGLEIGVVILALTFPVKMAMKTLRPVKPTMPLGFLYWALLAFVSLHCVIIVFYSKIEGVQLKNIVKAYYQAITPLVFYGLLMRYCETRTVKPTATWLFLTVLGVSVVSIPIIFLDLPFDALTSLKISVDWASSAGAAGLFRYTGLFLITASLAWWPASRNFWIKLLLLGSILLGVLGTLLSAGRGSMVECLVAVFVFSAIRRKIWASIFFALVVCCMALLVSANPHMLYGLPDSVHRALLPLNLSEEQTQIQQANASSDSWHHDLLTRSLDYWTADTTSIFVGHGFKSWDDSNNNDPEFWSNYELMMVTAIEMGHTENMFSSITNIFGAVGLVFYSLFLLDLGRRLWRATLASPRGTPARAICEFSLVNLGLQLGFAAFIGGTPGFNIIYWSLGLLAARPNIGQPGLEQIAPRVESFDRAREIVPPGEERLLGAHLRLRGAGGAARFQ